MSGYWGNGYSEGNYRCQVTVEMAIARVLKDVRYVGKNGEMAIVRVLKDVRLLGKSVEMAIVRVREVQVTGEDWANGYSEGT